MDYGTAADRSLEAKIANRTAQIGVIGLGYVGLPLSLMYAKAGFPVTGFDIDMRKMDAIDAGKSYIATIPASEIKDAKKSGFKATNEFPYLYEMDAIIICVPTPLNEYHEPDMSYITATAKAIAPALRAGQLVILESTTYPGTTEEVLIPILEDNKDGLKASRGGTFTGDQIFVAFSPEREDPGNPIARHDIPKVIGGLDQQAFLFAEALYGSIFKRTVKVSSPAAAEMTKLLENTYRCVNIALVNELKQLCMRMGVDIWEVIEAAKTKPFGFHAFYPGPGLGGHCIPIDPFYLSWKAKEFDFRTRFIELAGEININMPYHVVQSITKALNTKRKAVNGAKVLVLGLAYKKDIDDLRESPSLKIIELLRADGATVNYNDPFFPTYGKMKSIPLARIKNYDCVVIATDHTSYDYKRIVRDAKLVVDTRHATGSISSSKIVHC